MDAVGWNAELAVDAPARRRYRRRGLSALLEMGHCAPAVARTLADLLHEDGTWLVRLAAGLPGGIGDTGGECGGVTGALLVLGLRHGDRTEGGLPVVIEQGHAYCQRFVACHGSLHCRTIRAGYRVPWPCLGVVRRAPELLAETVHPDRGPAVPPAAREAYARLLAHHAERGFHCAHAVLRDLTPLVPVTPALLAATTGFTGGTLLQGLTCSALAAGVMAVGLVAGEVEDRRARVARMIATMAVGGDALADDLNRFNPSVNRGKALARRFTRQFGSTQCLAITGCRFDSAPDVARYVQGGQVKRCQAIARKVAELAEAIVLRVGRDGPAAGAGAGG